MESTLLQNIRPKKIYRICVTAEEAKRLHSNPALARATFNNIKRNENIYINTEEEILPENTNEIIEENTNTEKVVLPENTNEIVEVFKWPHEAVLLLLEEYALRQNDFNSGKMSQKRIWSQIAAELKKHNYHITGPQCLSKFWGLKRTYKGIKNHNNKPGNGTRTWAYFSHMETLLESKPSMEPACILSSTRKRSISEAGCSTSTAEKPISKKMQLSSNLEKLLENFIEDRKKAEEARERRHRENIELRQKLLDAFTKIIDVLKNK